LVVKVEGVGVGGSGTVRGRSAECVVLFVGEKSDLRDDRVEEQCDVGLLIKRTARVRRERVRRDFACTRITVAALSTAEQAALVAEIDSADWQPSQVRVRNASSMRVRSRGPGCVCVVQSGRTKQDYGPRANYNKEKIKPHSFVPFPPWAGPLLRCLVHRRAVDADFLPINVTNLEWVSSGAACLPMCSCISRYAPARGACIVPHMDHTWLYGDRIITVTLLSDTRLSLYHPQLMLPEARGATVIRVDIPLVAGSCLVLAGAARNVWLHGIERASISARRIACTFRELSRALADSDDGKTLLAESQAVLDRHASVAWLCERYVAADVQGAGDGAISS
jgi:alkylated DNA repair dioxygenase AlkB